MQDTNRVRSLGPEISCPDVATITKFLGRFSDSLRSRFAHSDGRGSVVQHVGNHDFRDSSTSGDVPLRYRQFNTVNETFITLLG